MSKQYKDTKSMIEDIEVNYTWWDKFILHSKMNWLRWLIYNMSDVPVDFCREVKWFIQRGRRGFSDRDIWSMDWWLTDIMPDALRQLKRNKHGVPCSMFTEKAQINKHGIFTNKEINRAKKRWNKAIDNMIYTFETAKKISITDWIYISSKDYNTKENKKLRIETIELKHFYIMNLKECKRYEQGWKLFQEHFFSLWD